MKQPSHIAWIALHTDGKDSSSSPIVEVAVAVTDSKFSDITSLSLVVNPKLGRGFTAYRPSDAIPKGVARDIPSGVGISEADSAIYETLIRAGVGEDFLARISSDSWIVDFVNHYLPKFSSLIDWSEEPFHPASLTEAFLLAGRDDLISPEKKKRIRLKAEVLARTSEMRTLVDMISLAERI